MACTGPTSVCLLAIRGLKKSRPCTGSLFFELWNPALDAQTKEPLIKDLMSARRAIRDAKENPAELADARRKVDKAKTRARRARHRLVGDGAPDFNRHLVGNTPYAAWYDGLQG